MPRGVPVPDETRAEVIRLHGQGIGRNEIARLTSLSAAEVSRTCHRAGLSFDRAETSLAVRARQVDLDKARTDLAQRMMLVAQDVLDGYDQPYEVFSFSKDGDFSSEILDEPTIEAKRSMMVTAAIAFDKATKVIEKTNPGLGDAVGVLDTILDAAKLAVGSMRERAGETAGLDDDEDDGVRLPSDA